MAKIEDMYEAVDDFGLITSAEAAELGMPRAEMVQQEKLGNSCASRAACTACLFGLRSRKRPTPSR